MQDQIAQIASNVYENGAMSSVAALLTSGNPQTLLSQSAFLTHLSTDQYQQLQQVITTERQLVGARQMAKRTEQAVAGLKKQLGSQRTALDKTITQQKALLASLTPQQQQQQLGGGGTTTGRGGYTGPTSTQAEQAVAFAYNQLGCPYVFGGTGPCGSGFDCSGLTMRHGPRPGCRSRAPVTARPPCRPCRCPRCSQATSWSSPGTATSESMWAAGCSSMRHNQA